nr:topless-related protein 3 isoform X3 [Ipomoea batatas]
MLYIDDKSLTEAIRQKRQLLGPNRAKLWEFTKLVDEVQCQMVSMPECSDTKVTRLLYTNSGIGILALSSNGVNLEKVIPCIVLSKNDSYIVSAAGGKISFFNILTFEVLTTFRPPSTPTFLVFYPCDNSIIAIGMEDGTIIIYNVRLKKVKIRLIKGHHKHITSLAFSTTDPKMLVSSSADAQLCVWNIVGRRQNRRSVRIQSPDGEVCSCDTHVMFHTVQLHLLLVTHETQLAIYDTSNMERKCQWTPQGCRSAPISSATYSCNSQLVYASFINGNIGVLDADNLTLRCCIVPSAYLSQPLLNSEDVVYAVVIAAHPQEPNQLAIGLTDGSIKVIEPLESEGEWGISPPIDIEILNGKEGEDDEGRGKSLDAGQGIEVGMSKHIDSGNLFLNYHFNYSILLY